MVQLQVLQVLKGSSAGYRPLVLPGGTAGGMTMVADYVPGFVAGETSVLFLDDAGRIVGGPQGKLAVVDGIVPAQHMSLEGVSAWVRTGAPVAGSQVSGASGSNSSAALHAAAGYPLIDSISPASASAGTNTKVTVRGSGFGTNQGIGGVTFWYGNLGHATIKAPVVSWSDTAIVCVVPTAIIDGYDASAGSGPVTVTTSAGLTSNNFDFIVTFSYGGMRWPSGGVSYRINANSADTGSEDAMVKAAAVTWNAASSFRFVDAGVCNTTSTRSTDGHNDIYWSNSALPAGVLAAAMIWSEVSSPTVILEADIAFNDSASIPLWGDGSGGTLDVQAVALHEMGHVLGLLDLYGPNDRGKVMYGIESDFSVSPRALTDYDRAGVAFIYGGGSGGTAGGGDDAEDGNGDAGEQLAGDAHLFSDLTPESPYFAAITDLAGKGIVAGFSDGTFRPNDTVTRQQFAKMIVKTLGLEVTGKEVSPFTDVVAQTGSDPFYPAKYVAVCAASGITSGKTATTFAPKESITRQQLITMVARAAGLDEPALRYSPVFLPSQFSLDEHYANASRASYVGLLDRLLGVGVGYDFKAPSTRAECAQLLSTMGREQPVVGPRVVFADDFSANEAAWPEFQWPDWRWLVNGASGRYVCSIDTPATVVLSTLPEVRGDCIVEVDARSLSTVDEVGYGLAFRVSADSQSLYGFMVTSKGGWELWRSTGGVWGEKEVLDGKSSGIIKKGRAWNDLRVMSEGSTIELWVNGNQVCKLTNVPGGVGSVGVLAASPKAPQGQEVVAFDNFKIWSVTASSPNLRAASVR